jgi:son of sevenless-like protein
MATLAIYGGHHPGFATNTTTTTTTGNQSLMPPIPPTDEQYITTFFCRALYDYQTDDPSSLSFRRDDIIEVLTQLESGWWDGLLGDERGWFPSNYVVVISDEEAEVALSASESSLRKHEPHTSHAMLQDGGISDHDRHWLEAEMDQASSQDGLLELANATMESPSQPSDFWMPQVTADGQVGPASITVAQ